ncbi:von Hippel-Lindau disease tumor suppressor-like [Babylonia areolata]|uniref:von Hippel-Lindau disease tumor suppressor-like n=1 Tax=Babylonia areolata TaxID=304850 RepID=UPI003FD53A36
MSNQSSGSGTCDLRSFKSKRRVLITFVNKSERIAELYWVDFNGKLVMYCKELQPGKEHKLITYVTHPWIARDSVTGQWLSVGGKQWYVTPMPQDSHDIDDEPGAELIDVGSVEVTIQIPVYRLQDICIGFFRKCQKAHELTEEQVNQYLLHKVNNIPKVSFRVYRESDGTITNE